MYTSRSSQNRLYALCGERLLGAVSYNGYRAYVFPLYTPKGVLVLQESPPDHPHHQGIMVGQDLVNGHNFWAILHPGHPLNRQVRAANFAAEADQRGLTVSAELCWQAADGERVLDEQRTVRFESWEECTFVEVTSTWKATYGPVHVAQTKEGGLGMRVHQQLEAEWGGVIRSSNGDTGEAGIFDTTAAWIEVSGRIGPNDAGIVMMPHPSASPVPWFCRNYGLHLYGPVRHAPLSLPPGGEYTLRVGFAAYDGTSEGGTVAAAIYSKYLKRSGA